MFNSKIWPNMANLQGISLHNMNNLEFDLSMSFSIKSYDAVGLIIFDFLFVSNHMCISQRLGVIATRKFVCMLSLLTLGPNFGTPNPP